MKKIITLAILGLSLFFVFGCVSMNRISMNKMDVITTLPAAQGDVRFCQLRDGNTGIKVYVNHLGEARKVSNQANTYVVWVQKNKETPPQNVGMLKVGEKLKGRLKTKTPLHSFDLFITPEASGQVQEPTGERLMWTSYRY